MKKYKSDWYWYYAINFTLVILILFPIYWTFISSVKTPAELITSDPTYFPQTWTWKYYFQIWNYDLSSNWQLSSDDYMSLESKSLKVALFIQLISWISQIIGHKYFEKNKPQLLNSFLAGLKKSPAPVSILNLFILSFIASLIK